LRRLSHELPLSPQNRTARGADRREGGLLQLVWTYAQHSVRNALQLKPESRWIDPRLCDDLVASVTAATALGKRRWIVAQAIVR
jgi:hypothetical protein